MKTWWLPLLLWAVLWLAGSVWSAIGLQQDLAKAAQAALYDPAGPRLTASAQGQQVVLHGTLHRASDLQRAKDRLAKDVRLPGAVGLGSSINPVQSVRSLVVMDLKPEGWGLLVATNRQVRLLGACGSAFESQRIEGSVNAGGHLSSLIRNDMVADADSFIEADALERTANANLPLDEENLKHGVIAFARWGSPWEMLDAAQPAEVLRQKMLAAGLPADAWPEGVSDEVHRARVARQHWLAEQEQAKQLAKLPPGHVVMAQRGDAILLRGELGTPQLCALVVGAVVKAAPMRRIIDELLPSVHRRPETDASLLTSTLPTMAGGLLTKMLAVGTPTSGWRRIDLATLDVQDESTFGSDVLPTGLDPRLVLPDVLTAVTWLQSINNEPLKPTEGQMLPHLIIAAAGDRVYLRGAVAEESVRAQIESAAKRFYVGRVVDASIRLDTACMATRTILQTVTTLPSLPAQNTTGLLGMAVAGQVWQSLPLRDTWLDEAGMVASGLLPPNVSAAQVMPDLLDLLSPLAAHLSAVKRAAPGIPLQSP